MKSFAKVGVLGALLCAANTVAVPAFAQAINPINPRPSTVQPPPSGEGSLQSILDTVYRAGNVSTAADQSIFGM